MIRRDYLLEQARAFAERLAAIRTNLQQGPTADSAEELGALLEEAEMLWRELGGKKAAVPELTRVVAELHAELGLLHGAMGGGGTSVKHLERAIALVEPLAEEGGRSDAGFFLTLRLNAGAVLAAAGDLDRAVEHLDAVVAGLTPRASQEEAPQQVVQLWIAALQNRATAFERQGDDERALIDRRMARDRASALAEAGHATSLTTTVDQSLRCAGLLQRQGRAEEALKEALRALEAAEHAVDARSGPFQALYIRSKIAVAQACFRTGHLSRGEDQVFEAIDAMPDLFDTVLVAMDFYADLLGMSDEHLEAGGLPREEVEDSIGELLAKLDARCDDEALCELAHARFDLLLNGRRGPAEALCDQTFGDSPDERRRAAVQAKLKEALGS